MKQLLAWLIGLFGGKKKPPVTTPPVVVPPVVVPPIIVPPVDTVGTVGTNKPVDIPIPAKIISPDRRPIGMIMLAEWIEPFIAGDRRWKLGGQYQFSREALLAHADECVKNMTTLNAQGMITWNIEGEEFWKPVSYIGDPRLIPAEMEPFIDEYFAKFKGFKTGVCIRPDRYDGSMIHYTVIDPVADLAAKVKYAKERWGCTLFYVDSNKDPGWQGDNTMGHGQPMSYSVFKQLAELFPDCLFIPEHSTPEYYPYVPVYSKGAQIIDKAVIVAEINQPGGIDEFVKAGNIALFEAWWSNPIQYSIKQAYENIRQGVKAD